jgi:hypothetical protein
VCPRLPVILAEFLVHIDASKVEKRILVIRRVIRLDLEVIARDTVVPRIDDGLHRVLLREELLAFV